MAHFFRQFTTNGSLLQLPMLRVVAWLPVFGVVYVGAFWLRFEGTLDSAVLGLIQSTLGYVLLTKFVVFGWQRTQHLRTRLATFDDLVALVIAASSSTIVLFLFDYLLIASMTIPRSVIVVDWVMTIVVVGGIRSAGRVIAEQRFPSILQSKGIPVFIVGANDSGDTLLRCIRLNRNHPYRVLGFITDRSTDIGTTIGGIPVLGTLESACSLAIEHGVREILVTAGELPGKKLRQLVEVGAKSNVVVKVVPSYDQLLNGTVRLQPRTVLIEDLLHREPVELHTRELNRWLENQVVLVTGSAGSIGSEICRQLLAFRPKRLVLLDRWENGQFFLERELREIAGATEIEICISDVCDLPRMREIFAQQQPDVVFHAAAYKHVPLMEANPVEAIKNITLATRGLADLSHQHAVASFVLISTDKAVNPTSVMGVCKRVAELYVQALAPQSPCRFVTVRFGNVLGSAGSVVPIFRQQIAAGGPVTVTHPEMRRYFMTISEASQLVIQAGAMGKGGEIFVLDMGEPIRIADLAEDMVRLSGLCVGEDIEIKFIGMRPGEKLTEGLNAAGEQRVGTSHPHILVAEGDKMELCELQQALQDLANLGNQRNPDFYGALKRLVPQYAPDEQTVHNSLAPPRTFVREQTATSFNTSEVVVGNGDVANQVHGDSFANVLSR